MTIEYNADELAAAFQRAAEELRADGDRAAAELADELYACAIEAIRDPVAKRAENRDDRDIEMLDQAG